MPIAQVGIEDGKWPRQNEDDEIGQFVLKKELQDCPFRVGEDGVPRSDDEIQPLLTPTTEESEMLDNMTVRDDGLLTGDGVSLASMTALGLRPPGRLPALLSIRGMNPAGFEAFYAGGLLRGPTSKDFRTSTSEQPSPSGSCATLPLVAEIQTYTFLRARRGRLISTPALFDVVLLVGLVTLGVVVPFAVGLAAGSQQIPRVDDWVYRRIATDLASQGTLVLHSVTTMLVGQIILVQPFLKVFGLQPAAFSAFGLVSAAWAVIASYALARQFLSPRLAGLATATLLVFPGYLAYSTSFMTDVPTLALAMTCLALGVVALRHRPIRLRWLLASMAAGCLAFSIREFAIAAPVAVLLAAICVDPRRVPTWSFVVGLAGWCALLVVLKSVLPGQHLGTPVAQVSVGFGQLLQALGTVSLALLPATIVAFVHWRRSWKRADALIGAELGIVIVVFQLIEWYRTGEMPLVLLGSLASQQGVPGPLELFGTRPLLFGGPAWLVLSGVALASSFLALTVGAGIAGSLIRRYKGSLRAAARALGSPAGVLVLFCLVFGLGLALYGVVLGVFDRYYWPLIPPAATLLMWLRADRSYGIDPRSTIRPGAAVAVVASLLGLALVSVTFMLNSFAFDSARWHAGETLAQLGVPPDEIDAGYEWVGSHAPSLADSVEPGLGLTYYEGYFSGYRACGVVSSETWSDPGYALVGTEVYSLNLIAGPTETLYLYRATSKECVSG